MPRKPVAPSADSVRAQMDAAADLLETRKRGLDEEKGRLEQGKFDPAELPPKATAEETKAYLEALKAENGRQREQVKRKLDELKKQRTRTEKALERVDQPESDE